MVLSLWSPGWPFLLLAETCGHTQSIANQGGSSKRQCLKFLSAFQSVGVTDGTIGHGGELNMQLLLFQGDQASIRWATFKSVIMTELPVYARSHFIQEVSQRFVGVGCCLAFIP